MAASLPKVLLIEQDSMNVARLCSENRVLARVDVQAVEQAGYKVEVFTRLLALSPQLLSLLISAQDRISLIGLDWPEAENAAMVVNFIENPSIGGVVNGSAHDA